MASRAEFLAERKDAIGGSDIASVFNVGYGCRRRLWYEKRDTPPDFPRPDSRAMRLGAVMEDLVAEWFAEDTGRTVDRISRKKHPDYPELAANVDRVEIASEREYPGALEIKSFGVGMYAKMRREGLPEDYILQLQQGMLCTGASWGSFAIGSRDNGAITFWDVEADPKIHALIISEGTAFWGLVENGPIPSALEPDDFRCQRCEYRRRCQGNALVQIEQGQKGELPQAEDLRDVLARYDEVKALFCYRLADGTTGSEFDVRLEEAKAELRERLGRRDAVAVGDRKVYNRAQDGRSTWDSKIGAAYERMRIALFDAAKDKAEKVFLEATYPPAETFRKQGQPYHVLRVY